MKILSHNGKPLIGNGKAYKAYTKGLPEAGVVFIDYDGEVITAWETAEVSGKTALPNNPTHERLIAQGWNWTLAGIKSYIQKYPKATVYVGQMYKTASGLTEFDITLTKVTGKEVVCNMVGNKDWGDGTTDALTTHTYEDYGDYTITCDGTELPGGSSGGNVFGTTPSTVNYFCKKVYVGENVTTINSYGFYNCYSLLTITIPENITQAPYALFYYCYSLISITIPINVTAVSIYYSAMIPALKYVSIPTGITTMSSYSFNECKTLNGITIPESISTIGSAFAASNFNIGKIIIPNGLKSISERMFRLCSRLTEIVFPSSIESIGSNAFYQCYSMRTYDFSALEAVPTLANVNAFTDINGLAKILVPASLYDEWIAATNWTEYADYIEAV